LCVAARHYSDSLQYVQMAKLGICIRYDIDTAYHKLLPSVPAIEMDPCREEK